MRWPRLARRGAAWSAARLCIPTVELAQYPAAAMATACADAGSRRSMGATGICWDNIGAESLWSTLKHEYYYHYTFATTAELVAAVDRWMHFYNTQQRHSTIGMLSPIASNNHATRATQAA